MFEKQWLHVIFSIQNTKSFNKTRKDDNLNQIIQHSSRFTYSQDVWYDVFFFFSHTNVKLFLELRFSLSSFLVLPLLVFAHQSEIVFRVQI